MQIATHSGPFHADDLFAVAILKLVHPDATVLRTRDKEQLAGADYRVDVGQVYNPETNDYDHHQPGGAGQRENEIPYAAAGLVWKKYGPQITSDAVVEKIDNKLIGPIDANDNGVELFEKPKLYPYTISTFFKLYAPDWQDTTQDFDAAFMRALELATFILTQEIKRAEGVLKAEQIVADAIKQSDGAIIILPQFVPWKRHAITLSQAIYCIYEAHDGTWRCHAIPEKEGDFAVRKELPASWGGLEDEALQQASGVPDAVFCHKGLFLAGAQSKEGALSLARKALE
ncbi:MAG: MYG1 family protein [Candidatus Woesearchaeota archaeon]|nr:MYG1 family protein [Candidatus Woesearchaeota archaeon]